MKRNIFILLIVIFFAGGVQLQTTKWRVVWNPNPVSDTVSYYTVYKGTTDVFSEMDSIGIVYSPDTTWVDSILEKGTQYYYRIVAHNSHGPSEESDPATESIPEIQFDSLLFHTSLDTTFSLNQQRYVIDPVNGEQLLKWSVEDYFPSDEIQHSVTDSININFQTPANSAEQDELVFIVRDTTGFYDMKTIPIFLEENSIPINPRNVRLIQI